MRTLPSLALVVAAGLVAAVSHPCLAQHATSTDRFPATPATATSAAGLLRPGDVIKVSIWREPDLSGEFRVDERGAAVLPRLGAVNVADISPDSLKNQLSTSYAVYLRNPSIEVTFLRRVSVAGAVRTPGVFMVDPTTTVADVIALAGGITPEGRKDRVDVMRRGEIVNRGVSRGSRIGATSVRSGDQLVVPERSWASRNTGIVMTGVSTLGFLVAAIINGRR